MALTLGTRLGSYEITSPLGQGGMGEVYRATDTKLGREVALKILPEVFAADADRLARFEREAKTLALLNHPNIAHVYDAGTSDHGAYLVMELVTGEDLSTHIARGAMSLSDTVAVARQLVEALEAAHESGIVHRDLKPANIKVRPDGIVKVLDFGLAKALDTNSAGATSEAMNSPTLTARATQMGMIIGTAAYMAPEQARGRAVDRRADIWAFGVVLYEMLSGRRAFDGEDVSITLAGVLKEDVAWSALPSDVPAALHRLLKRCLEKDPKRRLGWIGEARLALENPTADDQPQAAPTAAAPALPPVAGWRRALPWTMAVLGLGTAIASLAAWAPWRASSVPAPIRLLTDIGAPASLTLTRGPAAILSPDGSLLAFAAEQGVQTRLFVRKLDQLQATPLAGTEGAESPFFSPGGDWIGFFADAQLKKVPVTGGSPRKICDVPNGRGADWAEDGTIIYTPSSGTAVSLMRVSAEGGKPTEFGKLAKDAITQRWPQVLPGGRYVLYTESSTTADFNSANIMAAPLAGGPPTVIARGGYGARYVASPSDATHQRGHVLYMQQGTVFAAPVDLNHLDAVGPGVVALEGVSALSTFGSMQVSPSLSGTLVYAPGSAAAQNLSLEWLARDGKTAKLHADKSQWSEARFSPDGRKLAMVVYDGRQRDIWIDDVAQDKLTQFTFDSGRDRTPVWSPDGKRILFSSDRANPGVTNLYWMNTDGTGPVTRLTDSPNAQIAFSWYGKFILFQETRQGTGIDLMVLPLEGSEAQGWKPGTPTVFLATPGVEVYPQFSPDGRWVSYFAAENGIPDVWVRPFPAANGGQQRVSVGGGSFAKWSGSSQELVFSVSSRDLKVVPYRAVGSSFEVGKVAAWSPTQITSHGNEDPFALHPDGKRIAAAVSTGDTGVINDKVVLVFNFADYLDAIAPVKK